MAALLGAGGASILAGEQISVNGISVDDMVNLGPWGLLILTVGFVFYLVIKGYLVPKSHYDTLMERAVAAEAANVKLAETNSVQAQTIQKNTAVGDTVIRVMGAIQDARENAGGAA